MVTKEAVTMVCDLTDHEATEAEPVEADVSFGLDGVTYTIDLRVDQAAKLRDVLAPYVAAGREQRRTSVSAVARRRGDLSRERQAHTAELRQARAHLKAMGFPVADHGKIANEYWDVWKNRGKAEQPAADPFVPAFTG